MADSARTPESRTVNYLAPGVAPDLTPGTPTIDPALVEARDAEIKRDRDRAGESSPAAVSASAEPAKKAAPAKKSTKK